MTVDAADVEVVPVDRVSPSAYNPRTASPARLDLVRLSLSRFGWLLPIYATRGGEILSGHQRYHVATEMLGWDRVPVCFVDREMDLNKRQSLNLMFNRATNDLGRDDDAGSDGVELADDEDFVDSVRSLPELGEGDRYPCLRAEMVEPSTLLGRPDNVWHGQHGIDVTKSMSRMGIPLMPAVVATDGRVINGRQRLAFAAKVGSLIGAVPIPVEQADLAEKLLNKLSMDFTLEDRYADVLRYNSFRRPRGRMKTLTYVMTWHLLARGRRKHADSAARVDPANPKHREVWRKFYGTSVLDFGAGLLDKTEVLARLADHADGFEPFYAGGKADGVDPEGARWITACFLESVAAGVEYDSIFLSSVFNSVPFRLDRERVITIVSALSGPRTTAYIGCSSTVDGRFRQVNSEEDTAEAHQTAKAFRLGYEDRVYLTSYAEGRPKMQKFHTEDELVDLCRGGFDQVTAGHAGVSVLTACRRPKPVDPARLAEALDYEFDVPWPEGDSLGMAAEARAAFEQRLGIELPPAS